MITVNKSPYYKYGDCRKYKSEEALDYRGLSTDEKPLDAANGSMFLEIDTGNVFCFDKEHTAWNLW